MDLEIIKDNLMVKQRIETVEKSVVLEQDYILPDVKSDMISVLCSSGNIYVSKREMIGNKVKLEGGVNLYITYLADSGENRGLNPEIVFSELIDTNTKDNECSFVENSSIKRIDIKILNERKINIRVVLDLRINVFKNSNIEILKDINNCSGLQRLDKNVTIRNLVASGISKAQIKESVSVDSQDNVSDIVSFNVWIDNIENKISYNKVLVKADCKIKITYMTDDNRVCNCNNTIPVMGFVDCTNVEDSNICETEFRIKNMMVNVNSKEEHSIYVEMDFDIFSDVYEKRDINLIEDIYGLNNDIDFNTRSINVSTDSNVLLKTVGINEKVLIDNINQLFDVNTSVYINNISTNNNVTSVEGEVNAVYLFSSFDNQNLNSKEVKFGFNFDIPGNNSDNIFVSIDNDSSFVLLPDSTVESIINVSVFNDNCENNNIDIIDNIFINDLDNDDAYSMIIYFVQNGDSLWKIAKKFKSTIDEIAKLNDIENIEKIDVGQRLYIPRAV